MQDILYEFLLLNKKLSLPGVGTIALRQNAAHLDFTNKQFAPPAFYFTIESGHDKPSKKLFDWLSSSAGLTEWDAIRSINDFSFDLKNKVAEVGEFCWEKVGVIRRDKNGNLTLDHRNILLESEQPVSAEKVIRVKAEHTVLVGEHEKTSVQMVEYFAESHPKKSHLWLIAVILTVLAVIFIGWYFSEKGFLPSSTGNQSVINPN